MTITDPTNQPAARPYRLRNTVQHYAWGEKSETAFIAKLLGIQADSEQAFAELWMGTHPNGASLVINPDADIQSLGDWINDNPTDHLSLHRSAKFPAGLPYLFKVLSADQALSIQAHPNKAQAESLHKIDPVHYPDDNHKPEIAIAIDHLDALIGFISQEQYGLLISETPELKELLLKHRQESPDLRGDVLTLLALWDNVPVEIETCIANIQQRLATKVDLTQTDLLFLEQVKVHGIQDIGLLFLLFLNRVNLAPGEAVFLPPGIPHAYLKGNIIECMANSDNVVRLGLTKKFCDSQALAQILDFDNTTDFRVETSSDGNLTEYLSPTSEFQVKSLTLEQGISRAFTAHSDLSLFLVLEGEINIHWCTGEESCCGVYRRGDSFIVPAKLEKFSIQAKSKSLLYLVDLP